MLSAEVVNSVRLLGASAAEESGAVNHSIDATHRSRERIRIEQISLDDLDSIVAKVSARPITYERTYPITTLCQPSGETASDLSGRPSNENFHRPSVATGAPSELEETDMHTSTLAPPQRTQAKSVSCTGAQFIDIALRLARRPPPRWRHSL
jgi:hypothetical protein